MAELDIPLGQTLPPRQAGEMDIHHINTGSGNCTLIVAPDGTSVMIDAGASRGRAETNTVEHPDESKRPGEWQARYAKRFVPCDAQELDFLLVTHLHPDHLGDITPESPKSTHGDFLLSGVTDVDNVLPVKVHIDRSFPDYGFTALPYSAPWSINYSNYLNSRVARGQIVQKARAGATDQIFLVHDPTAFPTFQCRVLAANAVVWTGEGHSTRNIMPAPENIPKGLVINENCFCVATRFVYGRFSYFAGGDLICDTYDGRFPWLDVETPVVQVAGRTEVAAADHHGYFDACGPNFVKNLNAQAYIVQSWDVGHPGPAQVQRMLGNWTKEDSLTAVFATELHPYNAIYNRRFTPQLKSHSGHVIIRVASGGDSFKIIVTDSKDESDTVKAVFGPFISRQ